MFELLWLIPTMPFIGFCILILAGSRLPRSIVAVIGSGSVGISAVLTMLVAIAFIGSPPEGQHYTQVLWVWLEAGDFSPRIAFYLDALALVMLFVITFVGFLIHLYSTEFMSTDAGYARFFAYMNLFVGSMLTLVLADNLLLLYLGWEGVGLCSYLLIGFWYADPANGHAARKAFVVTRVGDTAMAIGLFLLFTQLDTLRIQELMTRAEGAWSSGEILPVAAALLLLGGAVGKSAQLPLQTWLPDAMAGPTPVSALIHAATMVTAGVYLIARTHVLFALAPRVMTVIAIVGAATLLLAGFSALTQRDIKRVLAYSTISQIGYMFLALGVGAWSAAMFHLLIHAFFKALLFLGAGVIILALDHEHDMFKMGGLRKLLPLTFWTFLIGAGALSAVPLVTAGFYSKDMIIWQAYASSRGGEWLWAAGLTGALLTSLYTFRMVFLTFFGAPRARPTYRPGWRLRLPLLVLAVLSLVAGCIDLPETLGNLPLFSNFLHSVLPAVSLTASKAGYEGVFTLISAGTSLAGIYFAYVGILRWPKIAQKLSGSTAGSRLHRFWFRGWGFDRLYDGIFVRPYVRLAVMNRDDAIDYFSKAVAWLTRICYRALSDTQTGKVRWYAAGIAAGAAVFIGLAVLI